MCKSGINSSELLPIYTKGTKDLRNFNSEIPPRPTGIRKEP